MEAQVDVVVVGGGPAGLSVANKVAESGWRVVLVEKKNEIGYPVRSAGASYVEPLRKLGIPDGIWHPIHRCRFVSNHNEVVKEYKKDVACVVDVRRLHQHLMGSAEEAGAQIHLGFTAKQPIVEDGSILGILGTGLSGEEVEVRGRVVVDATGFDATIARKMGLYEEFPRFSEGAGYELEAPNADQDEVVLMVGSQIAPGGYAWVFPAGGDRIRIGVGIIKPDRDGDPQDYLDGLLANGTNFGLGLEGAQRLDTYGGRVPSAGVRPAFVANGLVVVGDAAGQASALVGEGIRFSLIAGGMAAKTIAKALEKGDVSASMLGRYEKEWRKRYDRNFAIAYEANKRIARWADATWDKRFDILGDLTPEQTAQALQTDFTAGWGLKVLTSNPSLTKEGTEKLVQLLKRSE